jgi:type I restriction enzyme S subunit
MGVTLKNKIQRLKLGEILKQYKQPAEIKPFSNYKQVTIRVYHKGIVLRQEKCGQDIQTKQWLIKQNQFLISSIDARNGAMGIVPPGLDGGIITGNFFCYEINEEKINIKYFDLLTSTQSFVDKCAKISEGTTNRKRMRPEKFLEIEIDIPSFEDQKRVVERCNSLIEISNKGISLRISSRKELENLLDSEINRLFTKNYQQIEFGSVITNIKNGLYKSPLFYGSGVPCIRMFNIQNGRIDFKNVVLVNITDSELQNYQCIPDDIIINRINSKELVGKVAIIPKSVQTCIFEAMNIRIRVNSEIVLPQFVVYIINSSYIRNYFLKVLNQQCGQATLNQDHISKIKIPIPSLSDQFHIVAHLDCLQGKVDEVKRLQAETEREMEALVPAVLAKAFGGGRNADS